jgi:transcriptional regulator with XRE-family HTH domain
MSSLCLQNPEPARTRLYPRRHLDCEEWGRVPKRKDGEDLGFGARLSRLRKEAGYTQQELAQEIGVSRRMIAYYEGETERPPTMLLPDLAAALGVTTDALLGVATLKKTTKPDRRLQRRMQQIERMNPRDKRQVLQLLDAFIEREQLRKDQAR